MATPTSVVPEDISDWLATPAPFSTETHGKLARFSVSNSVVERREPEDYDDDCVVYTRDPLVVGQPWRTTLLNNTRKRWSGGLVSGCVPAFCNAMHCIMS